VIESFIAGLILVLVLLLDFMLISIQSSYELSNQARLVATRSQDDPRSMQVEKVLANSQRLHASLNLMLVITRFALSGLLFWIIFFHFTGLPFWLKVILIFLAALLLFWLEWLVEKSVSKNPETWAVRLSGFATLVTAISAVLLVPWSFSNEAREEAAMPTHLTEDELKTLVDTGQEDGIVEQGERRMIFSIFQLGDTLAREIMIPRIDMQALEVNTPLPEAIDALLKSGHSRVPVYDESIDNMVGLLYTKDLLSAWYKGSQLTDLRGLLREAYYVPEAKKVDELLNEMQVRRVHMAIVVDEYGGIAGLVTLEDIVEEIVGEIQDEYDIAEEAPYTKLKDGDYLFLGRVDLDDFNEIVGSQLPKEEAETLGGYIYGQLGRVPAVGEQIQKGDLLLTVEQVSARRIRKVRITWLKQEAESEHDNEETDGR
jgi:putative hemolysin